MKKTANIKRIKTVVVNLKSKISVTTQDID